MGDGHHPSRMKPTREVDGGASESSSSATTVQHQSWSASKGALAAGTGHGVIVKQVKAVHGGRAARVGLGRSWACRRFLPEGSERLGVKPRDGRGPPRSGTGMRAWTG